MSSHHLQSHSDPNYLLCLQNLRIDDSATAAASSNGRRSNSLHSQPQQQQLNHDARGVPYNGVVKQSPIDYKFYDRSTAIPPANYSSPKPTDSHQLQHQLHHHQQQQSQVGSIPFNLPPGYFVSNSPTHSLSGSSQHSESPRTSLILVGGQAGGESRMAHVYENIEYYAQPTAQQKHQQHMLQQSNEAIYFESRNKRAQPQVPSNGIISMGGRFAHTPQPEIETAPIYENLPAATG